MHISSYTRMKWFEENYSKYYSVDSSGKIKVLDIGSRLVDKTIISYKDVFSSEDYKYIGFDAENGKNVDIVPNDLYSWIEIEDNTFDVVISGQVFEHVEYIWLTIKEIERVLKPNGICIIIAPNTSIEHRYPTDCWRFFGDGLRALAKWSNLECLHTSVAGIPDANASSDWDSVWNDAVLIAQKPGDNMIKNPPQLPIERRIKEVDLIHGRELLKLLWKKIKKRFLSNTMK